MSDMAGRIKTILNEAPELGKYVTHCRVRGNADNTIEKQLGSVLMLRRACGNKNVETLSLDEVKNGLAIQKNGSEGLGRAEKKSGALAPETYRHRIAHAKKYYESISSPIAEILIIPTVTK